MRSPEIQPRGFISDSDLFRKMNELHFHPEIVRLRELQAAQETEVAKQSQPEAAEKNAQQVSSYPELVQYIEVLQRMNGCFQAQESTVASNHRLTQGSKELVLTLSQSKVGYQMDKSRFSKKLIIYLSSDGQTILRVLGSSDSISKDDWSEKTQQYLQYFINSQISRFFAVDQYQLNQGLKT